eukprot:4675596-Pleurochrysis_carterae.AAC.3
MCAASSAEASGCAFSAGVSGASDGSPLSHSRPLSESSSEAQLLAIRQTTVEMRCRSGALSESGLSIK